MAFVALNVPDDKINKIVVQNIYKEDLIDSISDLHITMFYNFPNDKIEDLKVYLRRNVKNPIRIDITGLMYFHIIKQNVKYDVLYLDVNSPILVDLVEDIKKTFHFQDKFDRYIPHITIAKIKYGRGLYYKDRYNMKYTIYSKRFIITNRVRKNEIDLQENTDKVLYGLNGFILEYVVPQHMTLNEWLAYREKHKITAKEYAKKHPKAKWKVVHSNPKQRGQVVKGMSNMTYNQAKKAHAAIMISKIKRGKI